MNLLAETQKKTVEKKDGKSQLWCNFINRCLYSKQDTTLWTSAVLSKKPYDSSRSCNVKPKNMTRHSLLTSSLQAPKPRLNAIPLDSSSVTPNEFVQLLCSFSMFSVLDKHPPACEEASAQQMHDIKQMVNHGEKSPWHTSQIANLPMTTMAAKGSSAEGDRWALPWPTSSRAVKVQNLSNGPAGWQMELRPLWPCWTLIFQARRGSLSLCIMDGQVEKAVDGSD